MSRLIVTLVACSFLPSIASADDVTPATIPATADLAVLERTPPSAERNLFLARLTLPKLDDRTPLEATIVIVENGEEVELRKMILAKAGRKDVVIFARACNPAECIGEGIVRLRERNNVTGKIETIDFPLVDAVEIEKP